MLGIGGGVEKVGGNVEKVGGGIDLYRLMAYNGINNLNERESYERISDRKGDDPVLQGQL